MIRKNHQISLFFYLKETTDININSCFLQKKIKFLTELNKLKRSNILFLPPYYSETLGRFKYDVSGLFNFTSIYRLYNLTYGT
jgi:hypothetical protein